MTRSCRTCRWFRPGADGQTGACQNPDLEQELGLQAAVRAKELHCRRGWNDDRWAAASDDIVLEVRFKSPSADSTDQSAGDVRSALPVEARSIESIVSAWDGPLGTGADPDSPRP